MKHGKWAVLAALVLSGCMNVALTCPDKASTVSYRGLGLFGATSVSCTPLPTGGYSIDVSGMNLAALAAMVAPLVMAQHPKAESEQDRPDSTQAYTLPDKNL